MKHKRATRRMGLIQALVVFATGLGVSLSAAQEKALKLFVTPSQAAAGPIVKGAAKPIRGAVRQRLVNLSLEALEKGIAPRGLDRAADRIARSPRNAPPLSLELFPGTSATFRKQDLEEAVGGGFVWSGVQAESEGAATLVVNEGRITGQVEIDGRLFKIEPVEGTTHRIVEIRPQLLPKDGPHLKLPPGEGQHSSAEPLPGIGASEPSAGTSETDTASPTTSESEPTISNSTPTYTRIDVLVAYTAAARATSADILSDINLAVSLANRAYANSAINLRIRLRGTLLVAGYNEASYDYTATLANLTGVTGYGSTVTGRTSFAPVRRLRDQIGADLVTLARAGGQFCGQGWVTEAPSAQTAGSGYSQFSVECIPGFVMTHELGHNMGLMHDRYVEKAAPASKYNFGFVNLRSRARDIMSYSSRCDAASVVCSLPNLFSNPRKLYRNYAFGIPAGKPGAADASRRLNETRRGVASYRRAVAITTATATR